MQNTKQYRDLLMAVSQSVQPVFEWAVCQFMQNCMNTLDSYRPQWIIWVNSCLWISLRQPVSNPFGQILKEVIGNRDFLIVVGFHEARYAQFSSPRGLLSPVRCNDCVQLVFDSFAAILI